MDLGCEINRKPSYGGGGVERNQAPSDDQRALYYHNDIGAKCHLSQINKVRIYIATTIQSTCIQYLSV